MDGWFRRIAAECELPANFARQLRDDGYTVIERAFTEIAGLPEAYDTAVLTSDPADVSVRNSTRVHDLVNRGPAFDRFYVYPPLLAACCRAIGSPFKLSSLLARTLEPGAAAQELHVDLARDHEDAPLIGFIVMVDEFHEDNGATCFVPGTVRPGNKKLACGPAGSMIIYDGSVLHGHTANRSAAPRRSIQGAFIRREARAAIDQAARIRPETLARISDLAKYILDVG